MTSPAKPNGNATRVHGAHFRRRPDLVVYRQSQVTVEPDWSPADQAKLALMRLMATARKTIQNRVNSLPGSMASTELWLRYRQIENAAQALGNGGLWQQAYAQFQQQYAVLLTAAPKGDAEPIGRAVNQGVGHVDCCGPRCSASCMNCKGRRSYEDMSGMLRRCQKALASGDAREANNMLARAKRLYNDLEPQMQPTAQSDIQAMSAKVARAIRRQDMSTGARGIRGADLGDFQPGSPAADINSRLDNVLVQAQSLGSKSATASGALESQASDDYATRALNFFTGGSFSKGAAVATGQADQQATSDVLDVLNQVILDEIKLHDARSITDDEHAWIRAREHRLQSYVSARGTQQWQESAPFRRAVTVAGGVTSALGITDPQSGEDVVQTKKTQAFLQDVKDRLSPCWEALVNGSVASAWQCLPAVGKVAVVVTGLVVANKARKAVL